MASPIYLEVAKQRTFACSLRWPGWARSGRTEDEAIAALVASAPRYAPVARRARVAFGKEAIRDIEVVERVAGNATTEFGAPGVVPHVDFDPVDRAEARRMAALVEASWATLDDVAASAPAGLRKGPRGGGRDRDPIVAHVVGNEAAYARKIGVRHRAPEFGDAAAVAALRHDIADTLRAAADAPAPGPKEWPARYAARRIAWHALDHAWEMEDRSDAGGTGG